MKPVEYFIASMSHELRNSLNGVVGYSQLLSSTNLDPIQKNYAKSLSICCVQLVSIVNDVLDFSKLSSGTAKLNSTVFSLKELELSLNSVVSEQIKSKRQQFRFIIDPKQPEYIVTDKQKLLQVLINLVSNSNKFTPKEGRIVVSVDSTLKETQNTLTFSIEDTGIGISPENQKKLFEPFFQVDNSKGSGLGLAISKKLVELLGGEIKVESDEQGSSFTFTIPYDSADSYKEQLEKSGNLLRKKYVLVADTDIEERLVLEELLSELGAKPVICSSSREISHLIKKKRYKFACCLIEKVLLEKTPDLENSSENIICLLAPGDTFGKTRFEYKIIKPVDRMKLLSSITPILSLIQIDTPTSPKQSSASTKVPKTSVPKNVRDSSPAGTKVLIVEDLDYNLDMMVKMLKNMNYTNITTCEDGEQAIKHLDAQSEKSVDIVLLDLKIPKVSGIEIVNHVKAKKYTCKIVVITASVSESDKKECIEAGVSYFLIKPVSMSQLKNVLKGLESTTNVLKGLESTTNVLKGLESTTTVMKGLESTTTVMKNLN